MEEKTNGKILQAARGFCYFEEKHLTEVRTAFGQFHFDESVFSFFSSIDFFGEMISSPGVFISGQINEKYTSEYVIKLFRKLMAMSEEVKNADLVLARENPLEAIKAGESYGTYTGIYFLLNSTKDNALQLAREVDRLIGPHDLWLRGKNTAEGSVFCLDVITNNDFGAVKKETENIASSLNLPIKGYVNANLYRKI